MAHPLTETWIGIDFSGDHLSWRPGNKHGNVWIAVVEETGGMLRVASLRPVQKLEGEDAPFLRLARFLGDGGFSAAGIDAPLSLPAKFVPESHAELLRQID